MAMQKVDSMKIWYDEAARLVTSRGPATAMPYSFKLAEVLGVDTSKLREAMLYNFLLDQK